MHSITADEAETFADIAASLIVQLGPFASAAIWHVGERHTDDGDPQLLADEVPGWLLRQPQQADKERA